MRAKSNILHCIPLIAIFMIISTTAMAIPPDYFITCDPDSFAYIYEHYSEDHYIPITVTYGGYTWPDCRMRIRGDSSRRYDKKSLRVKSDGEPFLNGLDVMLFNAEWKDPSYTHSILAARVFQEMGYPCFQVEHARLNLNGVYLGLYVRVENIDENFLARVGLDPNGSLYKATYDGATLSIFDDLTLNWEKKTNVELPWDDLFALREQVNAVPDADYHDWAQTTLDYDMYIDHIVANWWLANGSTYYHNYYVYHDIQNTGRWLLLPWDMDKTIDSYGPLPYHWTSKHSLPDNPLIERAYICEPIMADLETRMLEVGQTIFTPTRYFAIIDSLVTEVESSVAADTTDNVPDMTTYHNFVQNAKNLINHRQWYLPSQLDDWPACFRTIRTPFSFQDEVTLKWHPTTDPNGDPITYDLRYSVDRWWGEGNVHLFEGLTDTTFTLPSTPSEGLYYWEVYALDDDGDDHAYVQGFDSFNTFTIRAGTTLPAEIDSDLTLTAGNSPYLAPDGLHILPDVVVEIEAGVELRLGLDAVVEVSGELHANGTAEAPIFIMPDHGVTEWDCIFCYSSTGASSFSYVDISGGTAGPSSWQAAALAVRNCDVILDHCTFHDNVMSLRTVHGDLIMTDCVFEESNYGEHVNCQFGEVTIERCTFLATADGGDAVDFNCIVPGLISESAFHDAVSDHIEIGTITGGDPSDVTISDCFLAGAAGKAISVGEKSQAQINGCIIVDCAIGVAAKDSSQAQLDHCTLYGNNYGVSAYISSGTDGGFVQINNSILSQNSHTLNIEDNSIVATTYSLSDMELLPGEGNLFDDPLLTDPALLDFRLTQNSPAINSGDPDSPDDPDNTRTDMGAIPYDFSHFAIVINEINYNSSALFDPEDWIELHNTALSSVDVSGMIFKDDDDLHAFVIPDETTIEAQGFLVLCRDLEAFRNLFPGIATAVGDMTFGLSGSGEVIRLYTAEGILVDNVHYDDVAPWPTEPDGNGPTLELIDPLADNALASNWVASAGNGSPGRPNNTIGVAGTQPVRAPMLRRAYPNPFNPHTTISFALPARGQLSLVIYDVRGRQTANLHNGILDAGWHEAVWQGLDDAGERAPSGVYFVRMETDNGSQSQKIVLLR
ncbi:MAG: T9SS type A sorting domain-containing protein [bacterium]|nr:T9SS type A sorting domain-containing protein [bacterium]